MYRIYFYSKSIVLLLGFIVSVASLAAIDKIDAQQYSQQLRQDYLQDDAKSRDPSDEAYSNSSGSAFWRKVRNGNMSSTRNNEANILINSFGETWRNYRLKTSKSAGIILAFTILVPILLLIFFGKFKLKSGFSGEMVARFKLDERIIHWGVASLFILLGLTGLAMLLGKHLLIPVIGKVAAATIIGGGKEVHNIIGPVFSVFLLAMIIKFVKDNLYQRGDINWLAKGGGLFGQHVDSWRFNLGEKAWFWLASIAGIFIVASGFVLFFNDLVSGQRIMIEISHVIHTVSAILMISAMFGHIYMGVAMQGSISAMTKGIVDKNWAKEHHNLWYDSLSKSQ